MTTHLLDQAQAASLIAPVAPLLSGELHGAFKDWTTVLQNNPDETGGLCARVRWGFIHDRWVYRLTRAVAGGDYPMLRLGKSRGLNVAVVSDRIVLKLKKLDPGLRSRNIQTGQTVAFDNQQLVVPSEYGRVTNATGGYVPDSAGAEPGRIVVVCWDGRTRLWTVPLDGQVGGVVLEIPAMERGQVSDRTRTRIVPRPEKIGQPGVE
jgi:hypothetical protein